MDIPTPRSLERTAFPLLEALCATDSCSGREAALLPVLMPELRRLGAEIELAEPEPGRVNVLATWGTPRVLFSTHLDTVPPVLTPRWEGERFVARGACDAKGQIVAQLGALERLRAEGRTGFAWLGVCGEETDALGARSALAWADRFKPGTAGSGIQETVDYVLGKNALGTSFVTGTGERSAMNPHHRVLAGDTVALPFPGFVVGGPNADRQDDIKKAPWGVEYPHTEPAKCWVDVSGSYASNEVAINWNAALVFTLAALVNQLNQK